jgi:hypothetical protein
MLYTHKLTAEVLIVFMERLIRQARRKVFWIVDRHPVHRSGAVQQWLAEHKQKIEMFYLPSESPQLNPVEYLNCDVKQGVHVHSTHSKLDAVETASDFSSKKVTKVACLYSEVF